MRFPESKKALDSFEGEFSEADRTNSDRFVEVDLSDASEVWIDVRGGPLDVKRCPVGVLDVVREERDVGALPA